MSEKNNECLRCGSTRITKNAEGKLECLTCGYKWDPNLSREENDEENQRTEEEAEDEEEMDGALF